MCPVPTLLCSQKETFLRLPTSKKQITSTHFLPKHLGRSKELLGPPPPTASMSALASSSSSTTWAWPPTAARCQAVSPRKATESTADLQQRSVVCRRNPIQDWVFGMFQWSFEFQSLKRIEYPRQTLVISGPQQPQHNQVLPSQPSAAIIRLADIFGLRPDEVTDSAELAFSCRIKDVLTSERTGRLSLSAHESGFESRCSAAERAEASEGLQGSPMLAATNHKDSQKNVSFKNFGK